MQKATISEIKSRLSAYLKKVRAGETVLILDRHQPVAKIERVEPEDDPSGRLAELTREGVLRLAAKPLLVEELRSEPAVLKSSILATLLEERRESR